MNTISNLVTLNFALLLLWSMVVALDIAQVDMAIVVALGTAGCGYNSGGFKFVNIAALSLFSFIFLNQNHLKLNDYLICISISSISSQMCALCVNNYLIVM